MECAFQYILICSMKAVHPVAGTLYIINCWAARELQGQMNTFPPALNFSITSTEFMRKINISPVSIFFFFEVDDMHIYESLYLLAVLAHLSQKKFIIQSFLKVVFKL